MAAAPSKRVPRDLEPSSKLSEHVFHGGLHRPRAGSDAAASRQRLSLAAPLPAAQRRRRLDSSFHSSLSYSREGDISRASARLFAKAGSNLSASGPRHSASCPAPLRFISHLATIFHFCFAPLFSPPSRCLHPSWSLDSRF